VGAGVILTEGILVKESAVIAPGVFLSASVPIYDAVNKNILKAFIPKNAVVIPGCRPMAHNEWARQEGLMMGCAIIVKYRDDKTDRALLLEEALR
jgi:2,3,4,5-tetrahydropyridine-2-carboxylate N-succinyltransferase